MITGFLLLIMIIAALIIIVVCCSVFKWHPLLVLIGTSILLGFAVRMPADIIVQTIAQGAGSVFASIGFIIALGTILGEILEKSNATVSIARWIIGIAGKKNLTGSMSLLGGIVGIPVFCDSGFIILANLGRSLALETKSSFGAISIALATGLYATHVLVPPTPGPMAAAGNLGAADHLGLVILFGLITSIPAILIGKTMAARFAKRDETADLHAHDESPEISEIPSLTRSIIPLILPVFLITAGSVIPFLSIPESTMAALRFISHPIIALLIAVLTAIFLLPVKSKLNQLIGNALSQAGPIVFITVAGGAFGAILKATPFAQLIETFLGGEELSTLAFFPMVFILAAGLKTAQGSSTASLIIASSIIAPLLPAMGLDTTVDKALLVSVIGSGAMSVSHANDSYFWVIQQYSNISVPKMYRYFTLTTLYMGIGVLITAMLMSMLVKGIME